MVHRRPTDGYVNPIALAQPLKLRNGQVIRNRFMKAPMTEREGSYNPSNLAYHGIPSQTYLTTYEKFGQGEFGLLQTGFICVDPKHLYSAGSVIISQETDTPLKRERLQKVVENGKADGATFMAQLGHMGRGTVVSLNPTPLGVSDEQLSPGNGKPKMMSEHEVKTEIVDRFVYAAKVAKDVGFDGVFLSCAFGVTLVDFLRSTSNKRTDRYGGSAEKRMNIIKDIYDGIRRETPPNFLIGLKLNSFDFQSEELLKEAVEVARMADKMGFDLMEMSGGSYEKTTPIELMRDSTKRREDFYIKFAEEIRKVMKNTKMFATGNFRTVRWMVEAVSSNFCDGVGLGRPVCSEPDLPKKILHNGVLAAVDTKIDDNDFGLGNIAGTMQLWEAGQIPLSETRGDVTMGITDLSDEKTADEFKEEVKAYQEKLNELTNTGGAIRPYTFHHHTPATHIGSVH